MSADIRLRIGFIPLCDAAGEAVLLDSGTTAVRISREIADRRLTVMPLSLHAAAALSAHDSIRLLMPGGEVSRRMASLP